jgi:mannose-6-phosphate isomerase
MVCSNGQAIPLNALIERYPREILGESAVRRFGPHLPFLFKVLAAAEPLSIQAHPDRDQARAGFDRENRAGISLDAPHRNYRDDNHKPEVICALTPFWGMNGFRPFDDLHRQLTRFCPESLAAPLGLSPGTVPPQDLKRLFNHILALKGREKELVIAQALEHARTKGADDPIARWLLKLEAAYPGDIGILTPIILNLVRLEPGQAMFLPAGQLHAYLEGTGIELMANSDNVLRGGLTPKHIDREELLRVLDFAPTETCIMSARAVSRSEVFYPTPAEEFSLSTINVTPGTAHEAPAEHGVEILLVTGGATTLESARTGNLPLSRGESVLVPAAAGAYRLVGRAEVFKATVPDLASAFAVHKG